MIAEQKEKFEEDYESPDLAKEKSKEHSTSSPKNLKDSNNLLDDIDMPIKKEGRIEDIGNSSNFTSLPYFSVFYLLAKLVKFRN